MSSLVKISFFHGIRGNIPRCKVVLIDHLSPFAFSKHSLLRNHSVIFEWLHTQPNCSFRLIT